ncbi:MAG: S4 domain-containing protein, partial [Chroococcidiopsis sp.]
MTEIHLQVTASDDRLDRYLAQQLTQLSRSRLQQLIEQGCVQINDRVCT